MGCKCFLFGHSQAPYDLQEKIDKAVEDFYDFGFRAFVVGHHGSFDRMATDALRRLKERHPEVMLFLLTHYHPTERPIPIPDGFDTSFYPPEMESVSGRCCIVRANEFMIRRSEGIICYVGKTGNLLKKMNCKKILVRNLALEECPDNKTSPFG